MGIDGLKDYEIEYLVHLKRKRIIKSHWAAENKGGNDNLPQMGSLIHSQKELSGFS